MKSKGRTRSGEKLITEKVIAYITQGDRLLVFSHPFHPEAGIQVPAGTIKIGEPPEEAVLREAREETGLDGLVISAFLGMHAYDVSDYGRAEIQRRHFFHLEFRGKAPATWRHFEYDPSGGGTEPIEFELFWVQYPHGVPELIAGQGAFLTKVQISK